MASVNSASKQVIIVAGYYRSGTSALSGSLADLGVKIVGDAESNDANPKGFYESTELIKLDIRCLETLGTCWSDLSPLPENWTARADIQFLRGLLAEQCRTIFQDAPLVGVKHPHVCRLLPLYIQALGDIGYEPLVIHTHRSPFSIATSQAKKNNMTRAHSIALWASYLTSAEYLARGIPRTWVNYPDLIAEPQMTVRNALTAIGVSCPDSAKVSFVSKSLNRSQPAPAAGLFQPLADLTHDIEDAVLSGANEDVWDELRQRSADIGSFIQEIGRSGNRAAPGVGQAFITISPKGLGVGLAKHTGIHPLRPAERGDEVERLRVLSLLNEAGKDGLAKPTVSVMIAVPQGTTATQFKETMDTLNGGWAKPDVTLSFSVQPSFEIASWGCTNDFIFPADAEMRAALFGAMTSANTDYVAILNAGDRVEPDAVARFLLRTAVSQADMLYCDEIVAGGNGAWIRAKPKMSLSRLLDTCFVGDWVWYRRAMVQAMGGFKADEFPGAEEQDMQIRLVEAGRVAENVPDALFIRGEDTKRDDVPLETGLQSAERCISAHFTRTGLFAAVQRGAVPGLFSVEYVSQHPPRITLGMLCQSEVPPDLVQGMVNKVMPRLDNQAFHLVFVGMPGHSETMSNFLKSVRDQVSSTFPNIHAIETSGNFGGILTALQSIEPANHVAILDPVSALSHDDIVANLTAALDAYPHAGAIAPLVFFRDREQRATLHGPLLFGAQARVGAGYEASSPGPGGWLAATQPVDAVDGPLVIIRAGTRFSNNASSWVDVCSSLTLAPVAGKKSGRKAQVLWYPHRQVEIPAPSTDRGLDIARSHEYSGVNHHPAMSVIGSPLMIEARLGLVGCEGATLATTARMPSDGRLLSPLRFARQNNGLRATVVEEPVDALSILRARSQGRYWIRLNPQSILPHPADNRAIEADVNVWAFPPAVEARNVVLAAARTVATSAKIASKLRGMGARKVMVWAPKPTKDTWRDFLPKASAGKPTAIWIREDGFDVPWLKQLISQTAEMYAWVLVSNKDVVDIGNVAHKPIPVFEEEWARLFYEMGASVVIRPTPGTDWCDDYVPRLGVAAGCHVITGAESENGHAVAPFVTAKLSSDNVDKWTKTLLAIEGEPLAVTQRSDLLESSDFWLTPEDSAWLLSARPGNPAERNAA